MKILLLLTKYYILCCVACMFTGYSLKLTYIADFKLCWEQLYTE